MSCIELFEEHMCVTHGELDSTVCFGERLKLFLIGISWKNLGAQFFFNYFKFLDGYVEAVPWKGVLEFCPKILVGAF